MAEMRSGGEGGDGGRSDRTGAVAPWPVRRGARRRRRFLAYRARFDSPVTRGERGGGGELTGKLLAGGEGVTTTVDAG